jgi:hypothetical protein
MNKAEPNVIGLHDRQLQQINPFQPSGNYMYHLLYQSITLHSDGFRMILSVNGDYFLKQR